MIWVIGNSGMLGQDLCSVLKDSTMEFVGTDREVSILEPVKLKAFAEEYKPDWIINCSAYTAVDQAEDDEEAAFRINRDGVRNIALIAAELDVPVIHISTDYVFDGKSEKALSEEAPTGPVGVYGKSKLAGEDILRDICPKHYIVRTAWLYGKNGPNFVYTMLRLMNKLDSIKVVNDQIGSPTWTMDLANLLLSIIEHNNGKYGIYHFSGEGQCSWFDFAQEIYLQGRLKELISSPCQTIPCSSDEFSTKAIRPAYSLLAKDKVINNLDFELLNWKESLKIFIGGVSDHDII